MTDNAMGSYSDPNITPPMGQAAPLGLQHVLAMFASNVTPSIIVAGAAGLQFGGTEQVYLIQMAMLFAGIATLFQTVGFGPVGARLPIMQGTSFAFVGVLAGIAATQGLGVALTSCIIGGLIHFIINNQIGFTTNYLDARSSTYCTDVGKVTLSPVLHVNADDVEAVVHAMLFALDFRMEFKRDVFIDLLGYRKYGLNEGDEPRFTQPKLYKLIAKHPNPKNIYASTLIKQSLISEEEILKIESDYKLKLENLLVDSKKSEKTRITDFMNDEWSDFERVNQHEMIKPVDTTYPRIKLEKIVDVISNLPVDKKFIRKTF